MKKLTILTSVLALAACGGGAGVAPMANVTPMNLGSQYSRIACNSDRSECRGVTVDSNGNTTLSEARFASKRLSRAASTHGNIAVGNEQWDLFYADDIDMNVIYSPGEDKVATQTFILDSKGNITGLKWSGDEEVAEFVPGVVLSGMKYIGDNKFSLKSSESDGTLDFENYGDLNFANFGVVKIQNMKWTGHDVGEGNMDIPFAGGYNVLKQNPTENLADQTITYTGTARGMVEYAGTKTSDAAQDYLNITANNATLTLDTTGANVVETFAGNFVKTEDPSKHWYTITAINDNGAINYVFTGNNETESDRFDIAGTNHTVQMFKTGYYSDKKDTASEASGLFQYQEIIDPALKEHPGDESPMIQENNKTIYFGFGGKVTE